MSTETGLIKDPKDGNLRKKFKWIARTGGEFFYNNRFSPNQVTALGNLGVIAGSLQAYVANRPGNAYKLRDRTIASGELIAGNVLDFVDGAVADEYDAKSPEFGHDRESGGIFDAVGDRGQEIVQGLIRILQAHDRGNRYGQIAASISTIMQLLPSVLKVYAEKNDRHVTEKDLNTRPVRAVENGVGVVIPETQPVLDSISIATSGITIYNRAKVAFAHDSEGKLDQVGEEKQKAAEKRFPWLAGAAGVGILAVGGLNWYLHHKDKNHAVQS